jgi:hypothetical protein
LVLTIIDISAFVVIDRRLINRLMD